MIKHVVMRDAWGKMYSSLSSIDVCDDDTRAHGKKKKRGSKFDSLDFGSFSDFRGKISFRKGQHAGDTLKRNTRLLYLQGLSI